MEGLKAELKELEDKVEEDKEVFDEVGDEEEEVDESVLTENESLTLKLSSYYGKSSRKESNTISVYSQFGSVFETTGIESHESQNKRKKSLEFKIDEIKKEINEFEVKNKFIIFL